MSPRPRRRRPRGRRAGSRVPVATQALFEPRPPSRRRAHAHVPEPTARGKRRRSSFDNRNHLLRLNELREERDGLPRGSRPAARQYRERSTIRDWT